MVSYLMKKDTDDDGMTSNDGGRIVNTRDLARSSLLLDLQSERESVFKLKATAMSLQLNNTALQDVVEIRDDLVGEDQGGDGGRGPGGRD